MNNKAIDYNNFKKVVQSANLNLLIGSGASMPFLETLQDIEVALEKLEKKEGLESSKQDKDVLNLIEVAIKGHYFNKCIEKNIELLEVKDLLSNPTFNDYRAILQSLQTILSQRSASIVSNQVNLFTTNVDIFLDLALEELGYSINDGFSGRRNLKFGTENYHKVIHKVSSYYEYQYSLPLFNLFKLHGSLNWKFNQEKEEIRFDSEISPTRDTLEASEKIKSSIDCFDEKGKFKDLNELYDEFEKFVDELKEEEKWDQYYKNTQSFLRNYNRIIMVNPRKEKFEETTLKLSYYELLRMYSNNLEKENSVLFVMGFSFADEHIRNLTLRVAKANPTLLIVIFAYSEDSKTNIEKLLGVYPNIRYAERVKQNFNLNTINEAFFNRLSEELILPYKEDEEITAEGNQEEEEKEKITKDE